MPTNIKKNNAWGERVLHAWVEEWNKAMPSDPVPDGLLVCHDTSTISKYLRYLVLEMRSADGSKYPHVTIYYALCCLDIKYLRHEGANQLEEDCDVQAFFLKDNFFLAAGGEEKSSISDNQPSGTKFGSSSSALPFALTTNQLIINMLH